jgi:DNA-binding transcriptional regulator YiaG
MYQYRESGLDTVWLVNGYTIIDDEEFGECVSITDTRGSHKAIAHDLIFNKPTLTGAEFRFLRKELELSQKALADLLGKDEQAVARWEKAHKAPAQADRMLRVLVLDYYNEHVKLIELINRIRDIDEQNHAEQHFRDDKTGWKKAA